MSQLDIQEVGKDINENERWSLYSGAYSRAAFEVLIGGLMYRIIEKGEEVYRTQNLVDAVEKFNEVDAKY